MRNVFLKYFEEKLPVPRIIDSVEPTSDIPGAILMEYLQGNLINKLDLTETVIYKIGLLLAKIHTNRVAGYGDLTKPSQLSADPTSYFTFKFEEGIAECSNHIPKKMLSQCRDRFNTYINLLVSVDGPCITHRDFRPGNILIGGEKIQEILIGLLHEAALLKKICSLELGDWFNDTSKEKVFLEGYASIRSIPNYSDVTPLLILSKAIATIGFTVKTNSWDNKNKNLYKQHLLLLKRVI